MNLCFVVEGYPTDQDPFMPFVREVVIRLADKGIDCSVIAPQSISRAKKHKLPVRPIRWKDLTRNNVCIDIYQPYYISFSSRFKYLNNASFNLAAKVAYKSIKKKVDALYGHFWHMGVSASKVDKTVPVFVACGESEISVQKRYSIADIVSLEERLAGVIYVSSKSFDESKDLGLQKDNNYVIAPNGYDSELFRVMDRDECRKSLGWPSDKFIISFVGSFTERKGPYRVVEAVKMLQEFKDEIRMCFIGNGDQTPSESNIVFCGKAAHDSIPVYLNASDVFVLPTQKEGCCNAIIEALGCGLPVISSDEKFNYDILDDNCAILIDPMDIKALSDAIASLFRDSQRRRRLSEGAIKKAKELTIDQRANTICDFIHDCMRDKSGTR